MEMIGVWGDKTVEEWVLVSEVGASSAGAVVERQLFLGKDYENLSI